MKLYNNDVNVMTDVTNSVSYQCDWCRRPKINTHVSANITDPKLNFRVDARIFIAIFGQTL